MTANDDFASRVLDVVGAIPAGSVMTYGDVAAAIGSRAARGVGQVMAYAGADVPWWRVVRASGHPPVAHESRALEYYRAEGTPLRWSGSSFRVDLAQARVFLPARPVAPRKTCDAAPIATASCDIRGAKRVQPGAHGEGAAPE